MSIVRSGVSALGKLVGLGVLLAVFFAGMATVIFFSLQGREIKVPEITGKSFVESETELASLGLKIKKRADRVSNEPPNTIVEQLPKPGETVKTGQMILVVTSKAPLNGEEAPKKVDSSVDDSEKIEEMITDKPKKQKTNSNTARKKADTTRDVNAANPNSSTNTGTDNSNKKEPGTNSNSQDKPKGNTAPTGKPGQPSGTTKQGDDKPKNQPRSKP